MAPLVIPLCPAFFTVATHDPSLDGIQGNAYYTTSCICSFLKSPRTIVLQLAYMISFLIIIHIPPSINQLNVLKFKLFPT